MDGNNSFLSNLKPGDEVVLYYAIWLCKTKTIEIVEKITPKGFIRVRDMLFSPITGLCRGDYSYRLLEATPENKEEIARTAAVKEAYDNIDRLKRYNITYEAALKINKLVDELLNERRGEDE